MEWYYYPSNNNEEKFQGSVVWMDCCYFSLFCNVNIVNRYTNDYFLSFRYLGIEVSLLTVPLLLDWVLLADLATFSQDGCFCLVREWPGRPYITRRQFPSCAGTAVNPKSAIQNRALLCGTAVSAVGVRPSTPNPQLKMGAFVGDGRFCCGGTAVNPKWSAFV